MRRLLDVTGTAGTLGSIAFAAVAVARPQALSGDPATPGSRYYALMYAARAIPLGVALLTTRGGPGRGPLLITAATVQVLDAALGLARRSPGQALAPLTLAGLYAAQASRPA